MNEQDLRNTLNQIAIKEIPDDMNLIQDVQKALHARQQAPRLRSLRVAGLMTALLIFSSITVAAAVGLYQQVYDPGLSAVDEQGLFTELNLSQTVDDVTFIVQRGYADANRVALSTVMQYDMAIVTPPEFGFNTTYRLFDAATGTELPEMSGGGGGGGGGNTTLVTINHDLSFDATGIPTPLDDLDLRLEVTLGAPPAMGSGGSGGGGGGGGGGTPQPTLTPAEAPEPAEPITMTFEFALAFIDEYVLPTDEPMQTSDQGIEVRVDQISITPSLTTFNLCYTQPESKKLWMPLVVLVTGADGVARQEVEPPLDTVPGAGEICQEVTFPVPYVPGSDESWTLQIPSFRSTFAATQENADLFKSMLTDQGLEIDIMSMLDGSQTFYIGMGFSSPLDTDLDLPTILSEAYGALSERIEGTWSFTFDVP